MPSPYGLRPPASPRNPLWQCHSTLVGSLANGPVELGTRHHEGHSGWRIDQLDAHIRTWLRHSVPRTVLLLIGTNDMNQNYDTAQAPARLARLIDHIREARPACEVFVATVPPQSDPPRERRVRACNAALPEVVAAMGRRVRLVNTYDALTTADLADGLHPSQAGHEKMARVWHGALRSVPAALMPEVSNREAVRPCSSVGYRHAQRRPE
ncbi:SGNH/GDSL hydrolase family protein [Streptomyces sp. NPDC059455]|uniref:SGNH/GDSL hydrolase family protein n=1 Tax=Streptomyces sp. NPDC059455 TaxID=3346837 RepID=UPI00368CC573